MNNLLDSMKISKTQSSVAFYGFMFILVFFLIAFTIICYFALKNFSLQALQSKLPNYPLTTILYIFAGLIVGMILLMLINSQYEIYFQKRKSIGIDRPLPSNTLFWSPASTPNPQDPHNLVVTSNEFLMTTPETYAMGLEVMITDTRSSDKFGPYRHLVHRGTDDLKSFIPNSPGALSKGSGSLNDGLPSQMNPGIFVDQFSNDLLVFVDTDPIGSESTSQANRESVRIADVPLNRPFHIHVTVHDRLLEVYLNCRLAATKLLHGTPRAVPNEWLGRVGFARSRAIGQNLKLWNTNLWAIEVRNMCPAINMPSNMAPTSAPVCGSN